MNNSFFRGNSMLKILARTHYIKSPVDCPGKPRVVRKARNSNRFCRTRWYSVNEQNYIIRPFETAQSECAESHNDI